MLRIHVTGDDLARTRIAFTPDPMWELVLSLHQFLQPTAKIVFDPWRRAAADAISRGGATGAVRMLASLAPARSRYFPDFLTPSGSPQTLQDGLEAVRATPASQLRAELGRFDLVRPGPGPSPSWIGSLASGDPEAMTRLGKALGVYFDLALAPYQAEISACFHTDRALRSRALAAGGVEALLASLWPSVRWQPPVLEVNYPYDHELHLNGRGLLLVPSLFCHRYPITLADEDLPPVLVYPISPDPRWLTTDPGAPPGRALAALLGETKAAILEEIATRGERTTTELARGVRASAATVSYHTRTLREAGIIVTLRTANLAVHSLTPLGVSLLNGRMRPGAAPVTAS
jgi:DNA-binding transcriptional ArsR family regulator